MLTMAIPDNGL